MRRRALQSEGRGGGDIACEPKDGERGGASVLTPAGKEGALPERRRLADLPLSSICSQDHEIRKQSAHMGVKRTLARRRTGKADSLPPATANTEGRPTDKSERSLARQPAGDKGCITA